MPDVRVSAPRFAELVSLDVRLRIRLDDGY